MNPRLKALAISLAAATLAWQTPSLAATPEEELYRWGECAAAIGAYEAQIERGSANADIVDGYGAFMRVRPRVERYANSLAGSLDGTAVAAVSGKLLSKYRPLLAQAKNEDDPGAFVVKTFGPLLERCIAESETLPA